ncbi:MULTISPECIES: hypothetical protein [Nostocales]|uniref:C-type lysozyme inhibitor domain-containing protein n=3 Tax=Nostocales TaxID=1161 RepID=A0A0C1QSA7_9CYAN|nr:hypothetical protein [Tolypothrix bouteillei]KAF3889887.1 hypothetical protein DA73_0400033775 [Tolypothrix bouteillei VB521301]
MKNVDCKGTKSLLGILAIASGTASILTATLGIAKPALAARGIFSCSAEGVVVEVSRLNTGTLRYSAYNIPTTLQRPDLIIDNGTVRYNRNGETVYRFRNRNYQYVAVKDSGYGRVLVYRNNQLIATKYCGDV